MNRRVIIPRDSHEETTFAVVEFAGCDEGELLDRLRQALRLWAGTEEGKHALEEASGDFNVGDLAHHTPAGTGRDDSLSRCLLEAGITHLDIDVYSQDGVAKGWAFDTRLA
jgi:hypothetical protein